MSDPKVSSDIIANVLKSYYASKESTNLKSEKLAATSKNESSSSKNESSSLKNDKYGSEKFDAYSFDYRSSSSKADTNSKPSGQYDDYKDGSCTMEEDAYYNEMYPDYVDPYAEYPEYNHDNYPQAHEPPLPHGLHPRGPFPMMGFPRPPRPQSVHHLYPRGIPGPYPRGPHDPSLRGPPIMHHPPFEQPYNRYDHPDDGDPRDRYRGDDNRQPPDNRPPYNRYDHPGDGDPRDKYCGDDNRQPPDNRPSKRKYEDKYYDKYLKKFASEKSAKELYDFDKLPKVLTDLFTSATCSLCLVTLHQPGLMELHYRGKNHAKRMKGWLYKFAGEHHTLSPAEIERIVAFDMKPNDIPGVDAKLADGVLEDEKNDPTFCKLCNVPISSMVVAKQHYSGKKHMKALQESNLTKPAKSKDPIVKPEPSVNQTKQKWFCHVCQVSSSNEEQYETHLIGKRHKKAWKSTQLVAPVGLQNVTLSSHKLLSSYDVDPELLQDYELSLYCIRCREYFALSAEFTYHACPESDLLCKQCNTLFESRPERKYHECPRDHYCDRCDETFASVDAVTQHVCGGKKNAAPQSGVPGLDASYLCTLCRKTANSAISLDMHGKTKLHSALLRKLADLYSDLPADFNPIKTLPKIQYHCDKCDINFKDDAELNAHNKQGNHVIPIGVAKAASLREERDLGHFPRHKDEEEGGLPPNLGKIVIPEKQCESNGSANQVPESEEVCAYDIRNVDIKALLKGLNK